MGMLEDYVNALKGVPLSEAIPGGAGTTPEGAPTALSSMIGGVASLPKESIDAASRDAQHLGDFTQPVEAVKPATDVALTLMGAGAPAAEANAAGLFGGILSKGADLKALAQAKMMASVGVHPETVMQATGWFRHPADQQWRYEIPDYKADLKYMPSSTGDKALGSISSLVQHPEAFDAYPEFKGYRMEMTKGPASGLFDHNTNTVHVSAPTWEQSRSIALHEMQHAIQNKEGFSYGSSPDWYSDMIQSGLNKNPELLQGNNYNTVVGKAGDLYKNTAGEVEARNVQTRSRLLPSSLERNYPWQTQDVPFIDQYHLDPKTLLVTALKDTRK